MRDVVPFLAVLACPVGMGLCMWLMSKGKRAERSTGEPSIEELRAEHRRVSAELDAAEHAERSKSAELSTERS